MSVKQLNSSAVNVSWTRFDSEDVFYRVYYLSPPGQADFPGNSSWGVLDRLQPGQTQFQVAAVAVIQGIQTEGPRSDIIATTRRQVHHTNTDQRVPNSPVIAGTVAGVFVLLTVLLVIFGIIVSSIILYSRYILPRVMMS